MEVTSSVLLGFGLALNLLFSLFMFYTLNNKFQELPDNEFIQLTEIQHILIGIGQYLEAKLENLNEITENPIEKMKQMIPLLIGQKFFPDLFGGKPSKPSLTETNSPPVHGKEQRQEEE